MRIKPGKGGQRRADGAVEGEASAVRKRKRERTGPDKGEVKNRVIDQTSICSNGSMFGSFHGQFRVGRDEERKKN